jgi:eukaryotic-like serine/threonine-protein kinase
VATSIRCPDCQSEIAIRAPRAGRFRSKCPKCSALFAVLVPEEEGASPVVASLGAAPVVAPAEPEPDPDETVTQEIPRNLAAMMPQKPAPVEETVDERLDPAGEAEPPFQPPRSLGGYRVGRRLGPIRVGASFGARRTSTGREVALAVVRPRWTAEARFVARFAREAFAAGHLDHPNLIPPVDLGVDRGFAFVASEALDGEPLANPRAREGFDRTARVSAILHAARALRQAHEQGIYHRDLSLDRIRVDEAGLIGLADMGVGLTPETPEPSAVAPIPLAGSPPVVAPEPPSAAFVREDIAALGRALHSLIGGSQGDRALTPGLAGVTRRMLGEGPDAGYPDLGAVVRALEAELGVAGAFLPRDDESSAFEGCARAFETAPLADLRPKVALGSAAVLGLFAALMLLAGRPMPALGALGFGAIVAASTVALRGYFGRDPLFDRARELLLGGTRGDLLTVTASVALLVAALAASSLLGFWIFLGLLAAGLAAARYHALDRPVEQARAEPIARATALIRGLRRLGVDEDSIRRFACRQGGARWEEFFEALFGYEALRSARARWGPDAGGRRRPRFAPWRDPIIDAIDARLEARRDDRLRVLFQALEERNLEARGINLLTARRKSRRIAEAIVAFGRESRRLGDAPLGAPLMDALNRVALRPDDYLTTAESEEQVGPPIWREALDAVIRVLFGARTRFLLGVVFLAGFLLWMHQNALISAEEIQKATVNATADREKAVADAQEIGRKIAAGVQGVADASTETKALELAGLPPTLARRLDGFGLGVAGLILVVSAGFGGVRIAAFAIPGALIAALGPRLIEAGARPLGPTSLMAMGVGAGLFALGVAFGRGRE